MNSLDNNGADGVQPGTTVLYTRHATRYAAGATFPAIVSALHGGRTVDLCAFTPAPEVAWCVCHDTNGKPGTWRPLPPAPSPYDVKTTPISGAAQRSARTDRKQTPQ